MDTTPPAASASGNPDDEYSTDIRAFVKELDKQKAWYDIDWKGKLTLKNAYIAVSVISFVLLLGFGCVFFATYEACTVVESDGRCCPCLETDVDSPQNPMPRKWVLNGVYYALAMVLNSAFGISYVIIGVTSENQYQILIMLVTQLLECVRGIIDTALDEPRTDLERTQRATATVFVALASALLILSCVLVTPVYRSFGWASFKRAGARRSILQMYKMYQRFRALNRLDIQSSFLLFFCFLVYVGQIANQGAWVFIVLFVCDALASRFMVKYLKQEDLFGIYVSIAAKLFVVCWWGVVLHIYFECFNNFDESRALQSDWFSGVLKPNLVSAADSMNGVSCLAPYTVHDSRTYELVLINTVLAILFRIASILVALLVIRNFGKGLKGAMYTLDEHQAKIGAGQEQASDDDDDEGAATPAKQFIPKTYVKAEQMQEIATGYSPMNDAPLEDR